MRAADLTVLVGLVLPTFVIVSSYRPIMARAHAVSIAFKSLLEIRLKAISATNCLCRRKSPLPSIAFSHALVIPVPDKLFDRGR